MRVAVVGHVEWVRFARVPHVPRAGEVMHAREPFEEPAGGGAVAAVQLARLAGAAMLVTALGKDESGRRSVARLRELGVDVRAAARRAAPTRSAVTLVDEQRERTITTFGERLEPIAADAELPWAAFADIDAVYFTAGDLGALRAARAARVLVASPRAVDALGHGVALDALVLSADDAIEHAAARRARGEAALVVSTRGARGGSYWERDGTKDEATAGETTAREGTAREGTAREDTARDDADRGGAEGTWAASPPPGPIVDSYGCGDSFAAGLTYGLGAGLAIPAALELAARCGAACLTGRGPYERQLTLAASDAAQPPSR